MQIDLNGISVALVGDTNPIANAALDALLANGATKSDAPDMLVLSLPLTPRAGVDVAPLLATARKHAERMAAGNGGRILFLASAMAGMPMRRHTDYSVAMAAVLAGVRGLAMEFGPKVLVNALGAGAVGGPLLSGDEAMLSHASIKRVGTVTEITDTVLFFCDPMNSYTTGQLLSVDGGWSAGYARHF
ncbi:MAG TPA: SDR family oxidoreductase [Devosia sp.]|nr:SDR family oxidoreductase [Devosia sp.]